MKNSKKIVAIALALVMLVGGVIAGTMAWFTDDETKTDTVVVGSVGITLDYSMQDNVQLMPSQANLENDVDQVVKVTNTGKAADNDSAAYVRVQVYVPASYSAYLHFKQDNTDWTTINEDTKPAGVYGDVTIGGVKYTNYTLYYTKGTLDVEKTTSNAFSAIYLDEYVDCNTVDGGAINYFYGDTPLTDLNDGEAEIYVVAEAIQASGFVDDADMGAAGAKSAADKAWAAFAAQTAEEKHVEAYVPTTVVVTP